VLLHSSFRAGRVPWKKKFPHGISHPKFSTELFFEGSILAEELAGRSIVAEQFV
jgi:hypothetical protein